MPPSLFQCFPAECVQQKIYPHRWGIENKIVMISEGYGVEGLENLSFKVDNETGSFQSQVLKNGNTVEITVQKVYKRNFEKASQ